MKNYEAVAQWAATLRAEKAHSELQTLKLKYPWLKCEESLIFLERMKDELPKIQHIVKLQEKQNEIHKKFIELNQMADPTIVEAIAKKYNL